MEYFPSAAVDGPWLNMILANGFTPGFVPPQYMKDSRGIVRLRGLVVAPGGQLACWTLPAGYAPNMAATSILYFDWGGGSYDTGISPGRMANVTPTVLNCCMTSANVAGVAGAIGGLDRIVYQT